MTKFEELGLQDSLLRAIQDMGFETPSEVQEKAIPILLNEETDIVALAQTGTGKTAAFGFPLIQKIDANSRTTQGLILSPTRELCLQITSELKNYSKYENINVVAIYGGASITDQAKQVKKGAQIVVATPGRMQDMINRKMVDISKIEYCVLDEADEMLNMGFYEDITSILSHTPNDKSTWLFSATMPKEVSIIAKEFMHAPKEITVGSRNSGSDSVEHEYYAVSGRDRYLALKRLADANPDIFSVVFCRTKRDTQNVAEKLIEDGYSAGALHGDLSQNQRDLVMKSFRTRQIQMLVATDVAARGIDVDDITHVINYQLPDEIETYTHRSGRTGRAGKTGVSMVIVTKSEMRKIKSIERKIQQKFVQKAIPTGIEICQVQLFHLANKIHNTEANDEIEEYLPAIMEIFEDTSKEELIKRMVSVEFNRFYDYYSKTRDLNQPKGNSEEQSSRGSSNEHSTRYFINVGSKDGYDWMRLKDFLKETLSLGRDDVYKVDVKESFSFFNTDADKKQYVLAHFNDLKVDGRFVNVEESTNTGGDGGRRRKGGGRKRRSKDGGNNADNSRRRNRRSESAEASNGGRRGRRRSSEGGERFRGRSRRK